MTYIAAAKHVRDELSAKILNSVVYIHFEKEEKFGRLMGTIHEVRQLGCGGADCGAGFGRQYVEQDQSINQWLLDKMYALPFTGKEKKTNFSREDLQRIRDS